MNELTRIQQQLIAPKGQKNAFGNYMYRSAEDILNAYKKIAGETNVVCTEKIFALAERVYFEVTATLTDEKGNSWSANGTAREPLTKKGMDDAQVSGATASYAKKYALGNLFAIDNTKDADATNNHGKDDKTPQNPPPKEFIGNKEVAELLKLGEGQIALAKQVLAEHSFKSTRAVEKDKFEEVKAELERRVKKAKEIDKKAEWTEIGEGAEEQQREVEDNVPLEFEQ